MTPRAAILVLLAVAGCGDAPPAAAPGPAPAKPGGAPVLPPPKTELQTKLDVDTPPAVEWVAKGSGAQVKAGDVVQMHYAATIASSGHEIDNTHRTEQPFVFTVGAGHVIRGWDLLLPQLRVGDHVKTTIPYHLAYGPDGLAGVIPPKTDLTYDIEVVGIVPPPTWDVVTKGEGREAKRGTKATVHYVGTLPDGTVFDDSRARKEPFEFVVGIGEVIEGWDWVVARMRVGDRWKVSIPWALAYGADGSPPKIPAMTDLTFDIEVLRVE